MDLKYLVQNKGKCDELLSALDSVASAVNSYDYGLPMYDENAKARMREVLYVWASSDLTPNVDIDGA